jgi:hypothetical protein
MFQHLSAGTRHPLERAAYELIELAKCVDFNGAPAHQERPNRDVATRTPQSPKTTQSL